MKFCKDCKHYRSSILGYDFARCANVPNPVNGKPLGFCEVERKDYTTTCGPGGKFFEEARKE